MPRYPLKMNIAICLDIFNQLYLYLPPCFSGGMQKGEGGNSIRYKSPNKFLFSVGINDVLLTVL